MCVVDDSDEMVKIEKESICAMVAGGVEIASQLRLQVS
jgi:hypothetical protein